MSTNNKKRVDPRRWPGVYYYESEKRTFKGEPDRCYYIAYKIASRRRTEKVGWKSEGYTPQIAADERSKRMRQVRHGEDVKTAKEIRHEKIRTNRTIAEIADTYFKNKGADLKGYKTDKSRYDTHIKPLFGKRQVSTLSPFDMDRLKGKMKGAATGTVANTLELLRRLINYGAKHNLCPKLDFVIELPKKDNEVIEYLEPHEVKRLMAVLADWPSQDVARMLKLAFLTGMRRGEIFRLKEADVDYTQEVIVLRNPKGGKSVSIPMSQPVKSLLMEQQEWKAERGKDSVYFFPGRGGKERVDCSAIDRIREKAALPKKFRMFHGLRHHFAVSLANSGEYSLDMIGELLTHKSHAMTKRYGQFLPGTKSKASNRAAELLQAQISGKEGKVISMGGKDEF